MSILSSSSRRHLAWGLLIAMPMMVACSNNPTKPKTYALSGHVRLVGAVTTAVGDSTDEVRVDDADGVRVYLYQGTTRKDSTSTIAGAYAFTGLPGGSYFVAAALWGGIGDTVLVASLAAGTALDTLVLSSSATMPGFPNPFSTSTTVEFAIPSDAIVELSARRPDGVVVKTLVQAALPAGVHRVRWDGMDDASNPVSPGPYWILFKGNVDFRARLLVKG